MPDIVQAVYEANAGRDPRGLRLKLYKLRRGPFAFLRGTCQRFYQTLVEPGLAGSAPQGWICGDLHLENFGAYRNGLGKACVDINDFDSAVLAPLNWDLLRLLSSLRLACQERGWGKTVQDAAGLRLVSMYTNALARASSERRALTSRPLAELLAFAQQRSARQQMASVVHTTQGKTQIKIDGERLMAISDTQRKHVKWLLDQTAVHQAGWRGLRVKDAGLRLAGTGSLGLPRYLVLVKAGGRSHAQGTQLLDLKLATKPGIAATAQAPWPSEAQRTVTLQKRLQTRPLNGLVALEDGPHSWTLRPWQPPGLGLQATDALARADDLIPLLDDLAGRTAAAHVRGADKDGAACAQEMAAAACENASTWPAAWLHVEQRTTAQLQRDWQAYASAYDQGAFAALLQGG